MRPVAEAVKRVLSPNRTQMELRPSDLESLLPEGHRARIVWAFVEGQDLSAFYAHIKVVEGGSGRTAIDPKIPFALWLYATLEGIGSARQLARLTLESDPFRWICGGVQINHHSLSDFRSDNGEALDGVLTGNLACLMAAGVVKLKAVAQDGMRVRASAGAASFRRKGRLEDYLEVARERVQTLKQQMEDDPGQDDRRQRAAQERAVREREQRVAAALTRLPELEAIKERQGKAAAQARASTTDPEATVMKMGDGGYRPAYNIQLASDTESQIILGVDVVTRGSDMAQMAPMVEQVAQRCGALPESWLVDGGYPAHDPIDAVADRVQVIAPVPQPKTPKADATAPTTEPPAKGEPSPIATVESASPEKTPPRDPHQRRPSDSQAVGDWRERMGRDDSKELYKARAATAECVNAQARNRNLIRLPVRGLQKVKAVACLYALAHNLMRMIELAPELLGIGITLPKIDPMPAYAQ